MRKFLLPIVIVVIILAMLGGSYNKLVSMEENVVGAWAQVENQLQRRADLIPNLVETVKGYASHEERVLTQITEARSRFTSASSPGEYAEAERQLAQAINVVVESYPDLKANQNFIEFQSELSGTENRLTTERMRYNEEVKSFNTTIRRFPTNIIAGIFNFNQKSYFEINEEDAETPKVNF